MQHLLLYLHLIILLVAPRPADTLYTAKAAMDVYASQPERALQIIDSAEIVGNLSDFRADLLRAKVYAGTWEDIACDSAILIGERLMLHDSVKADPDMQENVLEILLNACRLRKDYEQSLHWATELGELYLSLDQKTEALRTDAEIGTILIRIGQQEEGLAKIDSVIQHLRGGVKEFNKLDASIIALKRKAEVCNEKALYGDAIPAAQHMLDLLDDYEQHPGDYHDGSIREPADDERPFYIDFYRGKAYAYLAVANASINEKGKADAYIKLYEQTAAGQSLTGRFMIAPTLGKVGAYDRMLAIYDEVEQELGADTLGDNYALILKSRAEAAEAQGRHAEANGYWRRYVALSDQLSESLLQGKAHLYAARFHAQEQQREIERHRDATRRAVMTVTAVGIIGLLILLFAIFAVWQWRKTRQHNRILAQQITEAVKYKEKYQELSTKNAKLSTNNSELPTDSKLSALNSQLSDAELFAYLRDLIESEKLYLNPNFERQTLIDRTGLSKERIGAAFAQGSDHERLTTLVREMRLEYAVRLMNEHHEFTVEQVCQASGFTNADTFTRNFKAKFGMTPTAYRSTLG